MEAGHIPLASLYTIRRGEPVRDNVGGDVLVAAEADIVKVRDRPDGSGCVFFDAGAAACAVYAHRPLECRVMRCWDTGPIEAIYGRDRLGRRPLLEGIDGLWDLVCDHEKRCSAGRLVDLAERRRGRLGGGRLDGELLEMVRYDEALRGVLVEQGRMAADLLDFVLGRPLAVVLRPLGIEVAPGRGGLGLRR